MDYGEPSSYLVLEEGRKVIGSDGQEVGVVEHVLADEEEDIFDGIVVDTRLGPGGLVFIDASHVAEIYENAVVLSINASAAEALPKPSANPAAMEHHGVEDLEGKLQRAWDLISGR
jgi:uncharacterized protein YrrD